MLPCSASTAKIYILLALFLALGLPFQEKSYAQDSTISNPPPPVINPIAYGLPGYSHHALPPSLWQDTPQHDVITLLNAAPPTLNLPSLLSLLHRLFTTEAYPPQVQDENIKNYIPYARTRIQWLIQHGYDEEALRLIGFIPKKLQLSAFGDTLVRIHLAHTNDFDACRISNLFNSPSPHAQLSIFCSLRQNDTSSAEFAFALYNDNHNTQDTLFSHLINFLLFAVQPPLNQWLIEPATFTPLHAALISLTPQPAFLNDHGAFLPPLILKTLANMQNLSLVTRVHMAEKLFLLQPEKPEQLRNLYALLALELFQKDPNPSPLNTTETHALYYAKTAAEKLPQYKAQYLKDSLLLAQQQNQWYPLAKLHEHQLLNLTPSQELAWFAPLASRTLFALGHSLDAQKWYHLIPPSHPLKHGLLAILHTLSSPENPLAPATIGFSDITPLDNQYLLPLDTYINLFQWQQSEEKTQDTSNLNILLHQKFNHNPSLFSSALPTQEPLSFVYDLFVNAVDKKQTGYAILLAHLMLSSHYTLPPRTLITILEGLRELGFREESLLIARDYILYRVPHLPPSPLSPSSPSPPPS